MEEKEENLSVNYDLFKSTSLIIESQVIFRVGGRKGSVSQCDLLLVVGYNDMVY